MKKGILVGFGFMGGMHAQIYRNLREAEIVAVVDTDAATARAKIEKLGLKAGHFLSLGEALAAVEADFVDVCLPTHLHAGAVLEAVAAGKHVFCEKPLAMSVTEGESMVRAAETAGIIMMAGHCIRFWPEYVALKRLIDSGEAGRLLSLTLQRRSARPGYTVDNWINDASLSGGAALDLHIHDTDFVLHLLGLPRSVVSQGTCDHGGWSHIFTRYDFPDGPEVRVEGGWNYPPKWGFQMAFQAIFENGAMEYDSNTVPTTRVTLAEAATRPAELAKAEAGSSTLGEGNVSDLGGYFFELTHFIECLEEGQAPRTSTGRDAFDSLRVTLAEIESAESGQPTVIQS
ncbi:MAG: Gfo/Idh/MocA family oxidoreductase [Opitutaceae bacterium]